MELALNPTPIQAKQLTDALNVKHVTWRGSAHDIKRYTRFWPQESHIRWYAYMFGHLLHNTSSQSLQHHECVAHAWFLAVPVCKIMTEENRVRPLLLCVWINSNFGNPCVQIKVDSLKHDWNLCTHDLLRSLPICCCLVHNIQRLDGAKQQRNPGTEKANTQTQVAEKKSLDYPVYYD